MTQRDFTEISMKSLPKLKYCLVSDKYDIQADYRSELWIEVKLYPNDCDSVRDYLFSLPEFSQNTETKNATETSSVVNE